MESSLFKVMRLRAWATRGFGFARNLGKIAKTSLGCGLMVFISDLGCNRGVVLFRQTC